MDGIVEEVAKGFFRGIGYILGEIFFSTICYWVGWPICKVLTGGKYPVNDQRVYLDSTSNSGVWCSLTGLVTIVLVGLYFAGQFS